MKIDSGDCEGVHLNIAAADQSEMEITSPSDGGALSIELISADSSFTNNVIFSSLSTSSITLRCESGRGCEENVIFGLDATSVLDYSCSTDCDHTLIFCPEAAECAVECSNSCHGLTVYTEDAALLDLACTEVDCMDIDVQCMRTSNGTGTMTEDYYQYAHGTADQYYGDGLLAYESCAGLSVYSNMRKVPWFIYVWWYNNR